MQPIPAGMEPGLTPVMSKLEILVQMWGETVMTVMIMRMMMRMVVADVDSIRVEGLSFQHTSYLGLDRGMDWQHAAVVALNSNGNNAQLATMSSQARW